MVPLHRLSSSVKSNDNISPKYFDDQTSSATLHSHPYAPVALHLVDPALELSGLGEYWNKIPNNEGRARFHQPLASASKVPTHMLCVSRRIVNEKQHGIAGSWLLAFGFFSEQVVNIAFCELSNAIAPNFSQ